MPQSSLVRRILSVDGMTCAHCAASVETAVKSVGGVVDAQANVTAGKIYVDVARGQQLNTSAVKLAIERAGYDFVDSGEQSISRIKRERKAARLELMHFLWSLIWSLPVLILHHAGFMTPEHSDWSLYAVFFCAAVLQPTSAITYYRGAIRSIRSGHLGMDVLVSLGIASGFTYATLATFVIDADPMQAMPFYEAATLLICFIRIGKYIEKYSRLKAAEAMGDLASLSPKRVRIVRSWDSVDEVPYEKVEVGQVFEVSAGSRIAFDGIIKDGSSSVNEAIVTGESKPRSVGVGDRVIAGAHNLSGRLRVMAETVGSETTIARIAQMVDEAQATTAPIQRIADRLSNYFIPVVVGIAILSGLYWGLFADKEASRVLTHVIGVIVIACPCALGLAVPAAIMIGSRACLKRGVLVKNGAALELLSKVDHLVFDKTGTLTEGQAKLVQTELAEGVSAADVACYVQALCGSSTHPIAQAAYQWSKNHCVDSVTLTEVREERGQGMLAKDEGLPLLFGSASFLVESGIGQQTVTAMADAIADGISVSVLAIDGQVVAAFGFVDRVRSESPGLVKRLMAEGKGISIASGDKQSVVDSVADSLGIEDARGGMSPEEKLELVRELQQHGKSVAIVGDGINDAPALAQADVGIAMGSASDISQEAGDIIVVRSGIAGVDAAMQMSRETRRGIHQNLVLSLVYNAVGIPLAAGLGVLVWEGMVIAPSYAALAMVLSDVSLGLNSARLAYKLRGSQASPESGAFLDA